MVSCRCVSPQAVAMATPQTHCGRCGLPLVVAPTPCEPTEAERLLLALAVPADCLCDIDEKATWHADDCAVGNARRYLTARGLLP